MNVLIANRYGWDWSGEVADVLTEFPDIAIFIEPQLTEERISSADVLIAHNLSKEQLAQAKALKCLLIPFTGINLFPLKELKARGVLVANSHGNGKVVAEHALALALAMLHSVIKRHEDLKGGFWNRSFTQKDYWTALTGLRCSVLGVGGIGGHVARLLGAFDCNVKGYRRSNAKDAPPGFENIVTVLDDAFIDSDIVFVCLPLTRDTTGLIGRDQLRMLSGGYLVNVSRGELVREEDLYEALKDGTLAGAAIDVWYNYPSYKNPEPVMPSKFPFHELPNVVMSPHTATHCKLARDLDKGVTLQNLLSFLRTGRPIDVVDLDGGY